MEGTKIESGCIKVPNEPNTWIYRWQDKEGLHEIKFTTEPGVVPTIGDYLVNGNFVVGERPQINQDHRMWIRRKKTYWDGYSWDE